eukprot:g1230.t1
MWISFGFWARWTSSAFARSMSDALDECMTARMLRLGSAAAATALAAAWLKEAVETCPACRTEPLVSGLRTEELRKFTVEEVAKHNTRDSLWIIVDNMVYDTTRYIDKHPGGPLMLENMAGKDCTDAFANYHTARVYKQLLPPMLIGEATDVTVPPHVQDFREVRQELLRRGLFETDMRFYAKMGAWLLSLFLLSLYLSIGCTSTRSHMLGAAAAFLSRPNVRPVRRDQRRPSGSGVGKNAL